MDYNNIAPPVLMCFDRKHENEPITKIILKSETHDLKVFDSKSRLACNRCMLNSMNQYQGSAANYKQLFRHWTKTLESTQFENNPLQHLCHYVKDLKPEFNEEYVKTTISELRNKIMNIIDEVENELLSKINQREQFFKDIQKDRDFEDITKRFKLQEFRDELEKVKDSFNMKNASATIQVNEFVSKYLIKPIQDINENKDVKMLEKYIRDKQILSVNDQKFDQLDQELPKFLNQYKSVISDDYLIKFSYIANRYIEKLFPLEPKENILDQYKDKIYGRAGEYTDQQRMLNYYQQLLGYQPYFRSGQGRLAFFHLKSKLLDLGELPKLLFLFKSNERKIGLFYNPLKLESSFLFDMSNQKKFKIFLKEPLKLDESGLYFGDALKITSDFKRCRVILDKENENSTTDVVLIGQKELLIEQMEIFVVKQLVQQEIIQQEKVQQIPQPQQQLTQVTSTTQGQSKLPQPNLPPGQTLNRPGPQSGFPGPQNGFPGPTVPSQR